MKLILVLSFATLALAGPVSDKLQVLADAATNATKTTKEAIGNALEQKIAVATFVGNTAVNAAAEAGGSAANFVSNIDLEKAINKTEEAIVSNKVNFIHGVFDAKRDFLRLAAKAKETHKDTVAGLLNNTVSGFNIALNTTVKGIVGTKQAVSDIASEVNMKNAQAALVEAKTSLGKAIDTTFVALDQAGSALTKALITAKMSLHGAAENFNSKETISNTTSGIASVVNVTVNTAGNMADRWGVFKALDSLVHLLAAIPTKINGFIGVGNKGDAKIDTVATTIMAPVTTVTIAPATTVTPAESAGAPAETIRAPAAPTASGAIA